jgi:glycerophosphoryl diester phosphodiesterase
VKLAAVLDEGGSLVQGIVPGLSLPVALIGIAEKGHVTLELRVEGRPGHSSAPPPHTSIGVLARALTRIEAAPMTARPWLALQMFRDLGAFLPFSMRFLLSNTWLFGANMRARLAKNPQLNAMQRTTTAITVVRGGVKDNILPSTARALVNLLANSLHPIPGELKARVRTPSPQPLPLDANWLVASIMDRPASRGRGAKPALFPLASGSAKTLDLLDVPRLALPGERGMLSLRESRGKGVRQQYTLAQLKQLDAGYRWTADGGQTFPFRGQGITIPTFEEVVTALPTMRINVDIKQESPSMVDDFIAVLERLNCAGRVMVGSFYGRELARFRRGCPSVATSAGVEETRLFYFASLAGLTGLLRPAYQAFQVPEWAGRIHVVTPRFIRAAHARGIEVHVWTVDEVADMQRLIDWGVDGLITDYPDRLMKMMQ